MPRPHRRALSTLAAALALFGPAASFAEAPFDGHLVQPPSIGAPGRGSVAGALSSLAFEAADLGRGAFTLPLPLALPDERGPLLADVLPSYSTENGLSEWGMGFRGSLEVKRFRPIGEVTFGDDDERAGPWGSMRRGDDGAWYPAGFEKPVRLVEEANGGLRAVTAEGTVYTFAAANAVAGSGGTYAWMLTSVQDVFGERTEFTYQRNASGRPFLSFVRYGGRGGARQVEVAFTYDPIATHFEDYQSGLKRTLDQRVREVQVRIKVGASYQPRVTYRLTHEASSLGPAFYLTQVDTTYASGQAEPPLRYAYDKGLEAVAGAALSPLPGLDQYLDDKGSGALSPNAGSTADAGDDGLVDVEHAFDNGLLRQTAPGQFSFLVPPIPGDVHPDCRKTAPASTNKPRLLARMSADAIEPEVVSILAGTTSTNIRVCDLAGSSKSIDTIGGNWAPGPLKRLVDVNRDGRPDLVSAFLGGYRVAANLPDGPGGSTWDVRDVDAVTPQFTPQVAWVHDLNGDGQPDLLVPGQGGLTLWPGEGNYSFAPKGLFVEFRTQNGSPLGNVADFSFTFLDANNDGLTDVVLSRNASLGLYLNRGIFDRTTGPDGVFQQVDVPAFNDVPAGFAYPLSLDLAGSGEEEVTFVVPEAGKSRAKAVRLTRPSTGLLTSADDGKGNRASFTYGRVGPSPGIRRRPVVLANLRVASGGLDDLEHAYEYAAPVMHSLGKFLVGFGQATRVGPLATDVVTFHHDDDLSGVVLATETRDATEPLVRFSQTTHEESNFRGVRLWRPVARDEGVAPAGGGAPAFAHTDYLDYQRSRCATRTRTETRHGTLETVTTLASVASLDDALHCLSGGETFEGRHADPSLDFDYGLTLDRNARGQVVKATAHAPAGPLVLQDVAYDALGRPERVGAPGRGTTAFAHEAATPLLARTVGPEGFATQVLTRDALTGSPTAMRADRGGGVTHTSSYRYDGLERLAKRWDDFGPSSEASPLEALGYAFATADRPGRVEARERVDATKARETKDIVGADGDTLLSIERFAGGWSASALRREKRSKGEARAFYRPPFAADADPTALTYADLDAGASELAFTRSSAVAGGLFERTLLQAGVTRVLATSCDVVDAELVVETFENGALPTRRALDEGERVLWSENQAGGRTERAYDALGRLVEVRLPGGAVERQRFDGYGRAHLIAREGLGRTEHVYDPTSGLVTRSEQFDAEGALARAVTTSRDGLGRATREVHEAAATGERRTFRFDYDGFVPGEPAVPGQLGHRTRTSGDGFEKRATYRRDGLLAEASVSLAGWRTLRQSYEYYDDGTPKAETWVLADGAGNERLRVRKEDELDPHGRLSIVRVNGTPVARVTYDGQGRLGSASLASGQVVTFEYDPETRDLGGYAVSGGPWSGGVRWSWNARGLVGSQTVDAAGASQPLTYLYDPRGFLKGASQAAHAIASYGYDDAGLASSADDGPGGPRDLRRVGSIIDAGGVRYEFDGLGRATRKGDVVLTYGPDGQLARSQRGAQAFRFVSDEAGERLLKTDDAGKPLAAYVGGGYLTDNTFVLPVKLNGRIVGVLEHGAFRSVLADPRGTLVGEGGAPNVPTPYGLRASRPGLSAALDYVEKGYDADLGTVRMGVRDYDPYLGQFLAPDPLFLASLSSCSDSPTECTLYGYAGNDPLRIVDPDGQAGQVAVAAGAAVGGALIGGGLELGRQLLSNGGSWGKVSWGRVGAAAAGGAVASGLAVVTFGGSLAAGGGTAATVAAVESTATSTALRGAAATALNVYSRGASNVAGGTVERTLNGQETTGEDVSREFTLGGIGGAKIPPVAAGAVRKVAAAFPRATLHGVSLKWLQKNKPAGWRTISTNNNEGWIWKDQNGVERLRFMRPTGKNASNEKWARKENGYFRWKNANDEFLDVNGKVVSDKAADFQERTHIGYEGPPQ